MTANETRVIDFLASARTQFVIPIYQRNYDWKTEQCRQFLDDVLQVGKDPEGENTHFIGSIVDIQKGIYGAGRINELLIIDGQQRLTTTILIYLTIHRLAQTMDNLQLAEDIRETYLTNKFAKTEDKKFKLKPTEDNERTLWAILNGDDENAGAEFSKIHVNFNYFSGRITKDNYETVLDGLERLTMLSISLDRGKDNPQRIFESLNSTGLDLSQSDLIRNYILMGLDIKEQEEIYKNYWRPIEKFAQEESTGISKVSDFIRDYLTLKNKSISNKADVYAQFKLRHPMPTEENLRESLSEIKSLAKQYHKLLNPDNEPDKTVRKHLAYIKKLEIIVSYPFLVKVYEDYDSSRIDRHTFVSVLELVQSFAFRRFVIGLPTSGLNKIFMTLYEKVDPRGYLRSVQRYLLQRTGAARFPKNPEIEEALRTKDMYNIKSKNRSYFFDRLENHDNREPVDIEAHPNITTEHIFPQNPDSQWKLDMDEGDYRHIRDNYLHTIANLTLSGNNGKLGNRPFAEKREIYRDSRLWLNRELGGLDRWGLAEMERRHKTIVQRFFEVWTCPDVPEETEGDTEEVNIFEADDPTDRKLEYAVFRDRKIEVSTVLELYLLVFRELFEARPEVFFSSPDLKEKIRLTDKKEDKWSPAPINDTHYIETRFSNEDKFKRIKMTLTLFDLEDELTLKYAK